MVFHVGLLGVVALLVQDPARTGESSDPAVLGQFRVDARPFTSVSRPPVSLRPLEVPGLRSSTALGVAPEVARHASPSGLRTQGSADPAVSGNRITCTIRVLRVNPGLDPGIVRNVRPGIDPEIVRPSICAP
jgi:hypothetical protein